jgi:hypothetical protein
LGSQQSHNYLAIFQNFPEPEGLLLYSQEPTTGPYPEPDESSPYFMLNCFIARLGTLWQLDLFLPYGEKS